jgi:hypothetical protein
MAVGLSVYEINVHSCVLKRVVPVLSEQRWKFIGDKVLCRPMNAAFLPLCTSGDYKQSIRGSLLPDHLYQSALTCKELNGHLDFINLII